MYADDIQIYVAIDPNNPGDVVCQTQMCVCLIVNLAFKYLKETCPLAFISEKLLKTTK